MTRKFVNKIHETFRIKESEKEIVLKRLKNLARKELWGTGERGVRVANSIEKVILIFGREQVKDRKW